MTTKNFHLPCLVFVAGIFAFFVVSGEAASPQSMVSSNDQSSLISEWWNGKYFTGNWFGLRDTLEDRGITFNGLWNCFYYGIVDSQSGAHGAFDQQIKLEGKVDFAKLTQLDTLEGLQAFVQGRYRQSINPNNYVLASGNFQPSAIESGMQWRLLNFGLTYTTPRLFGIKNFLTVTGGWLQPQSQFITQPLSKQFVNSSFASSKGIGADIPFSSSFSTWGGVLTLKPTSWYYAEGALFMAFPQAASDFNHGLAFAGYAPDPHMNGLMMMAETGVTPTIGASQLEGKYVFGGYFFGQSDKSYDGAEYSGFYGFYWQLDQMLYREPTVASHPEDGKMAIAPIENPGTSGKQVVAGNKATALNRQGLYAFNLFTFSPAYNQPLTFYFHSGLVYRGLIPTRDNDQLMAALSYGTYSYYNIHALEASGNVNQPNYTAVLEVDYRIQLNAWFYFQPFLQYIVKPNGTGAVENATILGFQTAVIF